MDPRVIGFYLVPDFPMIALASAMEPLRIANRLSGRRLYEWRLISREGAPVSASNGMVVAVDAGIGDAPPCDIILACAGLFAQEFRDRAVFAWLRRLHRQGCRLGGISTGTYLLARSGVLDGRRCTIHWENVASLAEEFPLLQVTDDIFVEDGPLLTCSGGTGTIDMMLHVIAAEHGRALATGISDQIMHPRIRGQQDRQRTGSPPRHRASETGRRGARDAAHRRGTD
jgi:transcriptional regulator GlxA family with amidase domain